MKTDATAQPGTGAVMVVGGGIAGAQAALDLAGSGFYVYLVEKSPSIGGVMAQLDKTFPTNDCSMCILSPKLVECGRHLNIKLITMADVQAIEGDAGAFTVTVRERPRYVDMEKCIACGVCAEKCPKKVEDAFNQGLGPRKAAYVLYPQAVPLKYVIDEENCIYFQKGKCRACEKFCPAGAVDFSQKEKVHKIDVGSVILAPGFKPFDPGMYDVYGYGVHKNVITSMEFERILSPSGPYQGHMVRPSDKGECRKIAWLQCVGSRDMQLGAHEYCSGVCCTYAIKQAVIAREHAKGEVDASIFYMDMRTFGKDFERYRNRAEGENGVRFIRSRVHSIETAAPGSDDLKIEYMDADGNMQNEVFDLVVLSVGLEAPADMADLAARLDVRLNGSGFAETSAFAPAATSRPGIFACGAFTGPCDIPSSVMGASAASNACAVLLSGARGKLTHEKTYPPEAPVTGAAPRIGVFVCHCGVNIGSVVDVPSVRDYAKGLPGVAYVADNMFTCSQDTQKLIREAIAEHKLNRVVVAACTPRTHEPLFQETIREAGLNGYLFEMANIRDHDSWVHQSEPEKATAKAKDLVRMAVAKVALLEPVAKMRAELDHSAMVVGGGVAGMVAALGLADQGFKTHLIERTDRLGGSALNIRRSWNGEDAQAYVKGLCDRVAAHPEIEVHTGAKITSVAGSVGHFTTVVESVGGAKELEHGLAIIATGAKAYEPTEYLYGKSPLVTRWHGVEDLLESDPKRIDAMQAAAFIQCVGSREPERPYCSKVCCTASVRQAILLKERKPEMDVYILYRDLRTYGLREELYTQARRLGVMFVRFPDNEKPVVESISENGRERLAITVKDHVLGAPVRLTVDLLNLATAIVPEGAKELAQLFKVPLNDDGFFLEAHMKLRPVDFATDGVFVCGLAHYPKPLEEAIAQAQAAAARAAAILARPYIEVEPIVSTISSDLCTGCGLCEKSCPYGAIRRREVVGRGWVAETVTALCKGCGVCAAACPQRAIDIVHFRNDQLMVAIRAGGAATPS
jgi:heterodisulfide reductase subunit A